MNKTSKTIAAAAIMLGCASGPAVTASAQEAYISEIREFAGTFCPRGWAEARGQLLPINTYQALFSLIGTKYGGDGRTTFALPDYRVATSTPPAPATGGEARIYQHCNYTGWSQPVGLGNYQAGGFGSNASFVDNDASAVKLSPGWEMVLYDGPNFNGNSITLSGDDSCLVDNNFNDKVSSVRVRRKSQPAASTTDRPDTMMCIALNGIFPPRN